MAKLSPVLETGHNAKEDVVSKRFLFQTKNVEGQSTHTLNLEHLRNLKRNASNVGLTGIYVINFGENEEFVLIRKKDFNFLLQEEESNEPK